ncbi:flagellar basal body rod protein FlgB [Salimicrobium halophilum]|uniref:Flagellar basal body rod protein FlgB n=1 Tax=Salimicrobium halophilum TaxID=86666 RepID=A0A1G8QB70_9BACI|nr:flagellar basal body rod protein FlgB [Salimicrobium halophilum]SDJ02012.1 flagellar basal-body rod protein FlgB [Salimicrobium halophilum]
MQLFGDTFHVLENSLNYASEKNRAISNNISNVDTPGYKAKDVSFGKMLEGELQATRTNARHLPFNQGERNGFRTTVRSGTTYNHNGNNVDIDKEMTELANNQIYYQALVDRISGKFRSLESVIKGGSA